jgi:hypothetical protein
VFGECAIGKNLAQRTGGENVQVKSTGKWSKAL